MGSWRDFFIPGRIGVTFDNAKAMFARSNGGTLRCLASTSAERMMVESDLPEIAESGVPGYDVLSCRTPIERSLVEGNR
jgi:tripartite-type tricarboxylate transporter receptor subunit TctC